MVCGKYVFDLVVVLFNVIMFVLLIFVFGEFV